MKKLFQKILSIILAIFIPTATVAPMAEPVPIDEEIISASEDYIFGGTNYGEVICVLKNDAGVGGYLYSNGEVVIHRAPLDAKELIIPDEIDGYPVTAISERAFASEPGVDDDWMFSFRSVIIGDNVRYIGDHAFQYLGIEDLLVIGKNVEEIGEYAFELAEPEKFVWNEKIKILRTGSFCMMLHRDTNGYYPLPESIEYIGAYTVSGMLESWVIKENVKYVATTPSCNNFIVLNMDMEIDTYYAFSYRNAVIYCLENSTMHELLKSGEITNEYHLIENAYLTSESANIGDDFTVSGLPQGLTEETIGNHLNIEGDAYIRISDETVKTGTKIELVNESPEFVYKTYTACIDGDINGDGSVNTTDDVNAIRKIITGNDAQFTASHKKAADLNGDGLVNSTDLVLMKSMQN